MKHSGCERIIMSDAKKRFRFIETLFLPFKYAPGHAMLLLAQAMIAGISPALKIIVMSGIINSVIDIAGGKPELHQIYPLILYMLLIIGFQWMSEEAVKFSRVRVSLSMRTVFRTAIAEKVARLDYCHIESNKTCDIISRVLKDPEEQMTGAFMTMLALVSLAAGMAGVIILVSGYIWWAALVMLVLVIPVCFFSAKGAKENYSAEKELTENVRRYEYLSKLLTGRDAAEERTLFGFTRKINEYYRSYYDAAYKSRLRVRSKWFLKMKTGSFVTSIASFLTVLVFIGPLLTGKVTPGFFVSLISSFFDLIQQMSWRFTGYIDRLAAHREYLSDLNLLLGLNETDGAADLPDTNIPVLVSVDFKGVRFKYPGTDVYVLDGVSFRLSEGRHYAFVGVNGAGKTTIIKLLSGLYGNYEGSILINGKELRSYSQSELKAIVSVLYQDFAKYNITLRDNILIGDVNRMDSCGAGNRLMEVVGLLGLEDVAAALPGGIDTPLGRMSEGGGDISGGQWQSVAIARALINPAPLKILDEPAASLDPLNESRLYEEFGYIAGDCTTIMISHRLGSTKLADEIFVIGSGRIIEKGTHEELMASGGVYCTMYNSQKDWYAI